MTSLDHPLDTPVWHALTTSHATLAQGGALARRYPPDMAPFSAVGSPTPEAFGALADLVGPGGVTATLTGAPLAFPPGWTVLRRGVISQMVCAQLQGVEDVEAVTLGEADVPDMLGLVALTRPGPFGEQTVRLGRYVGVREAGELIAMAGERLHLAGFTELSAVCTHPAHAGRGLAKALVQQVSRDVLERGEVPFLHVKTDNEFAVRAYRRLGFVERAGIHLAVVRVDGSSG